VRQPILTNEDLEKIRSIGDTEDNVRHQDAGHHLCRPTTARRHGSGARAAVRARRTGGAWRLQHHHPVGPQIGRTASHPGAAGDGGGAPPPDPQGPAHLGRPRGRNRRSARSAPFRHLAGYGAEAINPYLAFDTLLDMHAKGEFPPEVDRYEVVKRYIKAIGKGMLKVMSKMGISTYQSYCGAQIFDAVGLSSVFVDKYFTGTATTGRGHRPGRGRRETVAAPARLLQRSRCCATRWTSAASTPTACAARNMSGRPETRWPTCSTRCAATMPEKYASSPAR
jgi:glutamate synthase (NADPH/NADH) large chain